MQVRRYGITKSVGGADYCVEDGDGVASAAWLVRMRCRPGVVFRIILHDDFRIISDANLVISVCDKTLVFGRGALFDEFAVP